MHSNDVAENLIDPLVRLLLSTEAQILHPETQISMKFLRRSIKNLEYSSVAMMFAYLDTESLRPLLS